MSKRCLVIVILEDEHHEMLIRRYLQHYGAHTMRIMRSPAGAGSAENWVRKTFLKETHVYRNRHAQTKLIVVIDADVAAVQDRLRQLDQALTEAGEARVDSRTEQIARLIPKRNVETWVLCLNGQAVDEQTDYKKRDNWSKLISVAAETLFQWTRPNYQLPENCVDSLRMGILQLKHLAL